ncbi:dihydroxy-acid dehydratase [Aquabacterium sp.]|uniref:dihydroxy-acid dehydratase n=1 Tax=Aquabacterium sp. TaxID=1872578 RepID=UPI002B5F4D33|nr:dihydroxy-acid dehydratase [Aquabacterium sp.]HSW05036.1 dihydroxy-acid dehydratase [Aquabacterium sp.]
MNDDQPKRSLRSNFPRGSYLWSVRNAQWRALGIAEADCEKPKIAVVNSSSELASCYSHLDKIAAEVKQAIRAAGGLPFEIRTAAPSDFITGAGARGAYMLAARDLVTNDIEVAVEGAQLDGMICLTSCDKTVPGQLMAAARLNIPTLLLPCGYQASGEYQGRHCDIEDVFIGAMHVTTGALDRETLVGMSREAIRSPGVCSGMGTANSMHIVCEALGMALPGSAPIAASDAAAAPGAGGVALNPKLLAQARTAGARIVQMVAEDLKPRDILQPGAFANAVRAVLAVGGSVNCVKHLQAVASEATHGFDGAAGAAGQPVDVYALFEQLADSTPVLAAVRPVGEQTIEAFEAAGGCRAVLKQLRPLLDTGVLGVSGRTLAADLDEARVFDDEVIRPLQRPVATRPAIVVLRGTLCPDSGIVKAGIHERRSRRFTGPAICFDTADAALAAINDGRIRPGHAVVMRGAGPSGGPAMGGGASRVVFALDGAGLGEQVAMLTDGHLSGLVCKGLVVAEVAPEAALGGPLALVRDGDGVLIDLDTRRCELLVDEAELQARRAAWQPAKPNFDRGWLQIYRHNVGPLPQGAVLVRTNTQE